MRQAVSRNIMYMGGAAVMLGYFTFVLAAQLLQDMPSMSWAEAVFFWLICIAFGLGALYFFIPSVFLVVQSIRFWLVRLQGGLLLNGTIVSIDPCPNAKARLKPLLLSTHQLVVRCTDNGTNILVKSKPFQFFREDPLKDSFLQAYPVISVYKIVNRRNTLSNSHRFEVDLRPMHRAVILYCVFNPWAQSIRRV